MANPIIFDIVVQGARKAQADLDGVSASSGKLAKTTAKVAAAGAAAGVAFLGWVDATVATVDAMNTLEGKSALSSRTIAGLALAAKRAQKETKDIIPVELVKKIDEANRGSTEAAKAFDRLGVSGKDLRTKSIDEILGKILDGAAALPDDVEAAALSFQVMGDQGLELRSTLINSSASLEDFSRLAESFAVDTGPAAKEAVDDWQEAMFRLDLIIGGATKGMQTLIGPLAKRFNNFSTGLVFTSQFLFQVYEQAGDVQGAMDEAARRTKNFVEQAQSVEQLAPKAAEGTDDLAESLRGVTGAAPPAVRALTDINREIAELVGNRSDQLAAEAGSTLERLDAEIEAYESLASNSLEARTALSQLISLRDLYIDDYLAQQKLLEESNASLFMKQEEALAGLMAKEEEARQSRMSSAENQTTALLGLLAVEEEARQAAAQKKKDEAEEERQRSLAVAEAGVAAFAVGASAITATARDLTAFITSQYDTRTKEGRKAALKAFRANQAASVIDIGIATTVAAINALKILPPGGQILAGIITAQGLAAAGAVAAQSAPQFHIGHRSADEYTATLRAGERVLAPQAVDALGGPEGVARANAGAAAPYTGQVTIQMDSETIGTAFQRLLQDPDSPLSAAFRGMTPAVR